MILRSVIVNGAKHESVKLILVKAICNHYSSRSRTKFFYCFLINLVCCEKWLCQQRHHDSALKITLGVQKYVRVPSARMLMFKFQDQFQAWKLKTQTCHSFWWPTFPTAVSCLPSQKWPSWSRKSRPSWSWCEPSFTSADLTPNTLPRPWRRNGSPRRLPALRRQVQSRDF